MVHQLVRIYNIILTLKIAQVTKYVHLFHIVKTFVLH